MKVDRPGQQPPGSAPPVPPMPVPPVPPALVPPVPVPPVPPVPVPPVLVPPAPLPPVAPAPPLPPVPLPPAATPPLPPADPLAPPHLAFERPPEAPPSPSPARKGLKGRVRHDIGQDRCRNVFISMVWSTDPSRAQAKVCAGDRPGALLGHASVGTKAKTCRLAVTRRNADARTRSSPAVRKRSRGVSAGPTPPRATRRPEYGTAGPGVPPRIDPRRPRRRSASPGRPLPRRFD